jgi:hypothetical protein
MLSISTKEKSYTISQRFAKIILPYASISTEGEIFNYFAEKHKETQSTKDIPEAISPLLRRGAGGEDYPGCLL